jgi:hypothetical protein
MVHTAQGTQGPAQSWSAPNARTCLSLESGSRPGPTPSRGAGPRRGLIGQMGDESRLCRALAPIPFEPPKPVTAVSLQPRNSTTQSQNDGSRLRARQRESRGYPNVIVPGQEWRRAGLSDPAPATERDQTKLYGFVVNSWNDVVLSVQRIRTRTRTR